jgi:tRNA 5-methylaminomethyl-2-thiouridine biosynthesis bifunctional protein
MNELVAIVGAGLAGSSIAQRLGARGIAVVVLEAAGDVAQGASGNRAGVFRPLPARDDNRLARLLRAGFLYGRQHIEARRADGARAGFCGVLHVARDERHAATQRQIIADQSPPADFCRWVDGEEAAQLAGWPVDMGGWWFAGGGWVDPAALCRANLAGIEVRCHARVERVEAVADGWRLLDAAGTALLSARHVVFANAVDLRRLFPAVPVRSGRGLVSHLPAELTPDFDIVGTRLGYVTPAIDGLRYCGASFSIDDDDPAPRQADHVENLARLNLVLPGFAEGIDPAGLTGRVGFRPMSPDRLPIVGPLGPKGLWTLNGFGARGLVWAALCAELLAAQLCGEPLPVEPALAAALDPGRFARKPRRFAGRAEEV